MTLWIFLDNIIVWAPSILHFKSLDMRNLQIMKWGFAKKVIIKSQRQFMYGSNFYESDVILQEQFWTNFGVPGFAYAAAAARRRRRRRPPPSRRKRQAPFGCDEEVEECERRRIFSTSSNTLSSTVYYISVFGDFNIFSLVTNLQFQNFQVFWKKVVKWQQEEIHQ